MRKIKIIIPSIILVIIIVVSIIVVSFSNNEQPGFVGVAGEAYAVAVTNVISFDGLDNPENIFYELYFPIGLAIRGNELIVADSMCDRIQIFDGPVSERVGMPGRFGLSYFYAGAFIDGFREYAMFMKPAGVSVTPDGNILVSDSGNHAIRMIMGEFVITIAGNGTPGFANGPETSARFNNPRAAVMCPNGYIYVADTLNHVIRKIDPSGYVSLYAGAPGEHGFVNGSASYARFFQPSGLYLTDDGVLYVADAANHAIRRIENSIVTTIAGGPGDSIPFSDYTEGGFVDGSNNISRFNFPRDITLLDDGSVIVADSLNHSIRLITENYTRTLLGGGNAGQFHDSAENLQLSRPEGVAANGRILFISDSLNNRVLGIELTDRVLSGRPCRNQMLITTGLTVNSRFAFRGDIRVFLGNDRVDMGRVQPWIHRESIFIPIRPLLESVGANLYLNESTGQLFVEVGNTVTILARDVDYFILRGVMVTTKDELMRLFPYTIEWFPELSLITLFVPEDLREMIDV